MTWIFLLRKPPSMLGCNDPGIAAKAELYPLPYSSPTRFNDDPIALLDALLCCCIRMDLNSWIPVKFSESPYLSVFRVKESGLPRTRDQDVGIFLIEFWRIYRAFRRFPVLRKRIISHFFEGSGVKLKLPGRRGEPSLFVFVIFYLSSDVIHLLKIFPGDVHRLEDRIESLLEVVPPRRALTDPVSEVIEHFMI